MTRAKRTDGAALHLDKMTIADKMRTMEALWDDLCRRADGISSPTWHHDILKAREQGVLAGEASFCECDTAKKRIRESTS